jgi:glycosyltransferase involved in cell wall biosynthesis
MRIAMFTDYFFPELGGIQDSVAITSAALAKRGHQVDIHAPRYAARDYRLIGAPVAERDLGRDVSVTRRASLPFPSSTRQSRVAFPSPFAAISMPSPRARPDVIHVHSFFGIGLEALMIGARLRIPVVGTNHTTVAGFAPHIPISADRAAAFVRWFYNRCDTLTAPSRSVFDELGPDRLTPPRHVISNPIDTELFSPGSEDQRDAGKARFGLAGPTIVYAGRLGPEKNIGVLLRALAILRERGVAAELALAGHGSDETVLRAMAESLGIAPRVRFLGTLAPADLARLLQFSDIFTIMSTSETQSMVLLQAMASGIPVVAARTRALPEFVGPDNGLLVDPHDPAELAHAFQDLLIAPGRRRDMGRAGRRFAEAHGVETVTGAWEALYRSMLDGRSSR